MRTAAHIAEVARDAQPFGPVAGAWASEGMGYFVQQRLVN